MPTMTLLVEAIGGPKLTIEVPRSSSVEDIARSSAEATGRSLLDESGEPHKWRLFTPTAKGGFSPAKPDLDLTPVVEAMEGLRDRGEDGGFAGPGEHEGTTYLFRVRLFVPKPVAPAPPPEKPPPIEDEEAIDLTNLDEDRFDELETVRSVPTQKRKTRRVKTVKKGDARPGDAPRKRRKKKSGGPVTRSEPGAPPPTEAPGTEPATVEETAAAPPEAPPSTDAPPATDAPPVPSVSDTPAPTAEATPDEAHKGVVATPALAGRTPLPGDTAIRAALDEAPAPPPPKKARSTGIPKKARSTGIPKKARSTGVPKKARSTGIPKKARSTGVPKKARSTGIPKKARSTGVPRKGRSTGIPKKARSTGVPRGGGSTGAGGSGGGGSRSASKGGGLGGLLIALAVLAGVTVAFVMVFLKRAEPPPPAPDPTAAPTRATAPRLADQIRIDPYPTAEATGDADPVRNAIKDFNGIGARSGADLADASILEQVTTSAETLAGLCTTSGRFDACDAASRAAFARYLGCMGLKCPTQEAGTWFVTAAELESRALESLSKLEDPAARGDALKLVALQSVRLGGQSMRVLTAKAPPLAELATRGCGTGAMAARPDCKGVLAN